MSVVRVPPTSEENSRIARVVCVDLDGTLIATDLIWESLIDLIKHRPLALLQVPLWFLRGRAYLKERLAQTSSVQVDHLPYRHDVLKIIEALKRKGASHMVLATASHENLAKAVAEHLGLFDEVMATTDGSNLKGPAKAKALLERFGRDFLYVGDSSADLAVWEVARQGIVVGSKALALRAAALTDMVQVVETESVGWRAYWKALRPHHWSKNILLLLPLLLAHRWEAVAWARTAIGMLLFSLAASGIYVLNDLLDLQSDRQHPWKRERSFAAGQIPISHGVLIATGLLAVAIGAGWGTLGYGFSIAVASYCGLSLFYSLVLKRKPLVDVFVLTSFYGIRIVIGALITWTPLSHWFLIFSMFFFFSLALAKRYSELMHAQVLLEAGNSGRGYREEDSSLLSIMGVASAFAAIVVFSFYTNSLEVAALYPHPEPLLLICPLLLYWLVRIWLLAGRGELREDPVTLAMRDPMSYKVGFACSLCILLTFLWR